MNRRGGCSQRIPLGYAKPEAVGARKLPCLGSGEAHDDYRLIALDKR